MNEPDDDVLAWQQEVLRRLPERPPRGDDTSPFAIDVEAFWSPIADAWRELHAGESGGTRD